MSASPVAGVAAPVLDIAVGVLEDAGHWLIARRQPGTPGAGYWEFPGGKAHADEAPADCLARELNEEIGIEVAASEPLIRFVHSRGPRPVRLHVRRVTRWRGQPSGCEGQALAWLDPGEAHRADLLPATDVILNALALPTFYLITPSVAPLGRAAWLAVFEAALANGIRLVRLRDHALDNRDYERLAAIVVARARAHGARVLLDRDVDMVERLGADGLHWPASHLASPVRPISSGRLFAVSTHSGAELDRAQVAGADFATLSPVAATPSHPDREALGWRGWAEIRGDRPLCVLALGGLGGGDATAAAAHNAQGVAAIQALWPGY